MIITIAVFLFFLICFIWTVYIFSHAPEGIEIPGQGFFEIKSTEAETEPEAIPAKLETAEAIR